MENQRVDIAPTFSFKPIDDGDDSSVLSVSSSHHHHDDENINFLLGPSLSADIFRAGRDSTPGAVEKQRLPCNDEAMDDDASAHRVVISPYPFSHASREEITEREQLSNALSWTLASSNISPEVKNKTATTASLQVDCSYFYGQAGAETDAVMEDCDDFSVSIADAESLSRDLGLGDPASFWEEGASTIPSSIYIVRTNSPTEISLGCDDEESKNLTASTSTSSPLS